MKLIVDNNKFKMAFISGPRHNFLSLIIVKNKFSFDFELNDLSYDGEDTLHNKQLIKNQILDGLEQVNQELGSNYRISSADYLSADTPSDSIYKDLTINIIKEATSNGFLKKI